MIRYQFFLGLALGYSSIVATGCRPSSPTPSADHVVEAKKKVAEIAAGQPGSASQPALAAEPSVFTHPIDHEPQGRLFRKATRALDRGDYETAAKIRTELAANPQFQSLAQALDALVAVKQGQLEQALTMAEEISALQIMQGEAYVIAGEVFQLQNRLNEAVNAFDNALAINPQHVRAHLWIGAIYYDMGAMQQARTHLRQAAELEPGEVNALLLSAKINQEYEQYEEAVRDYRTALERVTAEDKMVAVQIELANCLIELRRLDEARELLASCPSIPAVLASRAAIAEAQGDLDQAAELASEALKLDPDHGAAGLILGRVYLSQSRWEEARQVLDRLVQASPREHEPRLLYGRALIGLGETEAGTSEIQRATELKDAFLKFAELHQEAIQKPDDAGLRVRLGQLAEELGRIELARTWYRVALGLDPRSPEAREGLERLSQ